MANTVAKPRTDIVVLVAGGQLAWMLVNRLTSHFGPLTVVREEAESAAAVRARRARRLGWPQAIGQELFGHACRVVSRLSRARRREVWAEAGLEPELRPGISVRDVPSVNGDDCRAILEDCQPKVVVVYGTRIIKAATLAAITAPFINYHAGINPKYRGQSGAYWALAAGDLEHAGLTIHLVDPGVDTGDILYQARSRFSQRDNFMSYHHVQMAEALPLLIEAIEDALAHRLRPSQRDLPSQQFYMPTLWGYVWTGLTRGVW